MTGKLVVFRWLVHFYSCLHTLPLPSCILFEVGVEIMAVHTTLSEGVSMQAAIKVNQPATTSLSVVGHPGTSGLNTCNENFDKPFSKTFFSPSVGFWINLFQGFSRGHCP
jgi:hypothetical protein